MSDCIEFVKEQDARRRGARTSKKLSHGFFTIAEILGHDLRRLRKRKECRHTQYWQENPEAASRAFNAQSKGSFTNSLTLTETKFTRACAASVRTSNDFPQPDGPCSRMPDAFATPKRYTHQITQESVSVRFWCKSCSRGALSRTHKRTFMAAVGLNFHEIKSASCF